MESEHPEPLAHITEDGKSHFLIDHLQSTAEITAEFAASFGCAQWGHLVGLWHDLGKYQPEFQEKLRGKEIQVEHSITGPIFAIKQFGYIGRLPAYVMAGHHVAPCTGARIETLDMGIMPAAVLGRPLHGGED